MRNKRNHLSLVLMLGLLILSIFPGMSFAQGGADCLNFDDFKSGQVIASGSDVLGFVITSLDNSVTDLNIVEIPGGAIALQFPDAGVRIDLWQVVDFVTVKAAGFGEDLVVEAYDSSDGLLDSDTIVGNSAIHTITLGMNNANIAYVKLMGGGGDGMLVELCLAYTPPPNCLDFDGGDVGINFGAGANFMFDGFQLMAAQGLQPPFIEIVTLPNGDAGIVFPEEGMDITLPNTTSQVTVQVIGTGNDDIIVLASNSNNDPVEDALVQSDGMIHAVTFVQPDIKKITVQGGSDGGRLVSICPSRLPAAECGLWVDFTGFPPETPIPSGSAHGDFLFGSVTQSEVNYLDGIDPVLFLPDNGLTALAINNQSASIAQLRVGAFAGSNLTITPLGAGETPITSQAQTVPPKNEVVEVNFILFTEEIHGFQFQGGGGEGVLESICMIQT